MSSMFSSSETDSLDRRQVDWRMLPLLGLLYALALIDRTNLGIARIAGLEKDLVSLPSTFSPPTP